MRSSSRFEAGVAKVLSRICELAVPESVCVDNISDCRVIIRYSEFDSWPRQFALVYLRADGSLRCLQRHGSIPVEYVTPLF